MIDVVEEAAKSVGSASELARRLGISPQALHQWKQVPPERVVDIERITGIPRSRLRSDLFAGSDTASVDTGLYGHDYYAWLTEQADLLTRKWFDRIDVENLIEELRDLGRSEQREIESRLNVLLSHLLKWKLQPAQRSGSWRSTILEQRARILRRLHESPSLKNYPGEIFRAEYDLAKQLAAAETGLLLDSFPSEPPFSIDQALDPDYLP